MKINGNTATMQVDTGAQCNVICYREIVRLFENPREVYIKGPSICLSMYNGSSLKTLGQAEILCEYKGKKSKIKFHVIKENFRTIIGCKSSIRCGFIKFINKISEIDVDVENEYSELFTGFGRLGEEYSFKIDQKVTPTVAASRRVPITLMKPLK